MFALCLIDRGASVHSFKVIKLRKMKDIINKILNYSLLAAKNVLTRSSELMEKSRQSRIEEYISSKESDLQTSTNPPYLIK